MTPAPDIDERFTAARSPDVHTVVVGSEAVLLDEGTNRLHHLNATATLVWSCYDGISTLAEIVADLSDAFGRPHGEVLSDTLEITRQLGGEGLLAGVEPVYWQRRLGVLSRRALEQVVVCSSSEPSPVRIAGSGASLWEELGTPATVGELAAALAERYDTSAITIASDIRPLLGELEAQGIVERVAASSS